MKLAQSSSDTINKIKIDSVTDGIVNNQSAHNFVANFLTKEDSLNLKINTIQVVSFPNIDSEISWVEKPNTPKVNKFQGEQKQSFEYNFLLLPLFIILALLIKIKPTNNKKITQYFNTVFSNRFFEQLLREDDTTLNPLSLRLLIVYCLSAAVLLFNVFVFFGESVNVKLGWQLFLLLSIAVPAFLLAKIFVIQVSNLLFFGGEALARYIFSLFTNTKILGLLLIVPIALSSFGYFEVRKMSLIVALVLYLLMFALRIGKSLIIGWQNNYAPKHYIILYICTLEIIPIVIFLKILDV